MEVRCPDCNSSWSVGDVQGGELFCPGCLRRIQLGAPSPETTVAASAASREAAPKSTVPAKAVEASSGAAAAASRPAPAAASPPEAPPQEIVCPRCKLHFYPRGRKTREKPSRRRTVLVVEDQEIFQRIATDALEPDFEVRTAGSTDEARRALAEAAIDLIVLDLTLDGGEEGRQLLSELTPKPCPILIFTARDEAELYGEDWDELRQLGADDLVMKGMKVAESLARKTRQLLGDPVDEEDSIG